MFIYVHTSDFVSVNKLYNLKRKSTIYFAHTQKKRNFANKLTSSMDYSQTLAYLYASQPAFHLIGAAAYKPGFDNILQLMSHLGNPHQKLRCIHVAGTNGKG